MTHTHTNIYEIFTARLYVSAVDTVLQPRVRSSVRPGMSRETRVATSSSMRLLLQTHSSGVVCPSTRPIATDAQQWRGQSIHAAYCYRRTAVAWSVHLCGLLLQTRSSGVVGPSTRPIATDEQQWRGRSIHAAYCYRRTAVAWSVHPRGLLQ